MTKTLPDGTVGFTRDDGTRQCTGAAMGRRSWRGYDAETHVKCYLRRLRWVNGDYDEQGAYWGYVPGTSIYWANFDIGDTNEDIFVRATSREDAKAQILQQLSRATFFN